MRAGLSTRAVTRTVSKDPRAPGRAKVPVAESLTALLRTRQVLLAAPGAPGAERHGTEDKRKAHERSPGRVVIGAEHGEGPAQRGDSDRCDGIQDVLHDSLLSQRAGAACFAMERAASPGPQ